MPTYRLIAGLIGLFALIRQYVLLNAAGMVGLFGALGLFLVWIARRLPPWGEKPD